jgi:hypothetical protein
MNRPIASLVPLLGILILLSGCATEPVDRSGISSSITVPNSNPKAIRLAAQESFSRNGYTLGRGTTALSLFFQRPTAPFAQRLLEAPTPATNFSVRLQIVPLSSADDFRLVAQVAQVDIRSSGNTQSMRLWKEQFESILREIRASAKDAGPAS